MFDSERPMQIQSPGQAFNSGGKIQVAFNIGNNINKLVLAFTTVTKSENVPCCQQIQYQEKWLLSLAMSLKKSDINSNSDNDTLVSDRYQLVLDRYWCISIGISTRCIRRRRGSFELTGARFVDL
ncbi:hypothetical protein JOB18_012997 [Solea senegalensis]|uniref:Uncharacterized protein n=1 Tax=Solea senegalensis TaxID=28829 RepID=A0AAV6PDX6_SOLSE|nr:hypothetical protein JOB18_012997 [Solea senegalensis]